MKTYTTNVFGDDIECNEFFDIVGTSTTVSGVEIFRNGDRLGSMIGVSLPDQTDNDEVEDFNDELENWLVENEF